MSSGLLALLDDVAALVKATAVSLDDVATQAAKTSSKVSGIVIDDAAVTPKFVVGLSPERELTIIYRIAQKSLLNKLVYLTPLALLLGFFAPFIITPLLMIGGAYLCFEGYEKIHAKFAKHHESEAKLDPQEDLKNITPQQLEKIRIDSAVRTDFVLSAEIIAITYASVAQSSLPQQIAILLLVGVGITVAVYGAVALIVKADDFGLYLAKGKFPKAVQAFGRSLVRFMPHFLAWLSVVGTLAMLWVGADIIIHGIASLENLQHTFVSLLQLPPIALWLLKTTSSALLGVLFGALVAAGIKSALWVKGKFI